MAWIEKRSDHVRVVWREGGRDGHKEYEKFALIGEAEVYKDLVNAAGNRRPTIDEPADGRPPRPIAGLPCTVERWADYWMSGQSGIRARTLTDYKRDLRNWIIPEFGDREITDVASTDVGAWVLELTSRGRAPKTIRNLHGLLFALFDAATYHEPRPMRPTNPCARTRLPEIPGREMHFLTHAEFGRLYEATPERYRPLVLLLVLTGLRWGEATGLYARHLSLTTNPATLRVVQSYQRTDKGQFEIGPPKTKAARRTLSLPANLVAELLPLWQARNGGAFLFTSSQGTPVRHSNFYNRVWKPTVKRAGLPDDLRIHDLRHSYASWLIAGGRPLPSIQRRLGHESITTTIDRYGHLLPEVDLGDLTVLEEAFALPATVSATPAAA